MASKQPTGEVFAAGVSDLYEMSDTERREIFTIMAYDIGIASNKMLAAKGARLIEMNTTDKVVEILRRRPDLRAMRERPELEHLLD